jgi:hypothetical protein
MKKFALVIFAVAALLYGCTSVNVRPVANVAAIKHVCVRECPNECFVEDMPEVIAEGFERNGISAEIFAGNLPSSCEYHVRYMCNQTWDMAMYMHHAEIRLYQGTKQIGYAEYHLDGQGGLSLMKWQGTRAKIDPVMDELLGK